MGPKAPRLVWFATLVGVLLSLPTLALGFFADDYNHLMLMAGYDVGAAQPWDIYRFMTGHLEPLIERGPFPWWTNPELKIAFMRPIATAMFRLDYALFGYHPVGYHVHAVAWYGVLILVVGSFYRRLFPDGDTRVPALGVLVFAIDEAHAFPVGWIAARYALVVALFMVLCVWAHVRHREDGWSAGGVAAPLAFCASLAGGEAGLCTLAFLFAYELFADGSRRQRWVALVPFVVIAVVYLSLHRALGYGVSGSGLYVHPFSSTARFLAVFPERLLLLLASLFGTVPIDATVLDRRVVIPFVVLGAGATAVFGLILARALRRIEARAAHTARWLTAGSILSLVPTLGAPVGARLTLFASVGMSVVFALLIVHTWQWAKAASGAPRLAWGAAAVWLATQQLLVPAPGTLVAYASIHTQMQSARRLIAEIPVEPSSKAHLVFLSTSDIFVGIYGVGPRVLDHRHQPSSWHATSLGTKAHRVERIDDRTLELSVVDGQLLETPFEQIFRVDYPPLGFRVETLAFTAEVVAVENGRPSRLALTFKFPLEGEDIILLTLTPQGVQRVPPPTIGATTILPPGPTLLNL